MTHRTDRRDTAGMTPAELADEMEWRALEDAAAARGYFTGLSSTVYSWPLSQRPGYAPPLRGYSMAPTKADKAHWKQRPVMAPPRLLEFIACAHPLSDSHAEATKRRANLLRYGFTVPVEVGEQATDGVGCVV